MRSYSIHNSANENARQIHSDRDVLQDISLSLSLFPLYISKSRAKERGTRILVLSITSFIYSSIWMQ